jgi:hypothetical protein
VEAAALLVMGAVAAASGVGNLRYSEGRYVTLPSELRKLYRIGEAFLC